MKPVHILPAALLAFPVAAFGLQASMGVKYADGTSYILNSFGAPLLPTQITVTVSADEDLSGLQFSLLAMVDHDYLGPAQPLDASTFFRFTAAVSTSGKAANPFAGPTRLHSYEDGGIFDSTGFDATIFSPSDYRSGFGPNAVFPTSLPTSFVAARPEVIFRDLGETEVQYLDASHTKVITYTIESIPDLPASYYYISVGNWNSLGFKACNQASGCVDMASGDFIVYDNLTPEPTTALLLLAALPLLRQRIPATG